MDTSHDITHISFRQTIVTSPSPTHRFKNVIFEIDLSIGGGWSVRCEGQVHGSALGDVTVGIPGIHVNDVQ